VEVAERWADDQAGMSEVRASAIEAHLAWDALQAGNESLARAASDVLAVVGLETEHTSIPNREMVIYCLHHAVLCAAHDVGNAVYDERAGWQAANAAWGKASKEEERVQTRLVRDIFGNPLHNVPFNPSWRTEAVLALARQMYESRDFSAMPILADAIQDAGCNNNNFLDHCRDANTTHVRGCWVVDLVLGKE
jgi:hypothetical protein